MKTIYQTYGFPAGGLLEATRTRIVFGPDAEGRALRFVCRGVFTEWGSVNLANGEGYLPIFSDGEVDGATTVFPAEDATDIGAIELGPDPDGNNMKFRIEVEIEDAPASGVFISIGDADWLSELGVISEIEIGDFSEWTEEGDPPDPPGLFWTDMVGVTEAV